MADVPTPKFDRADWPIVRTVFGLFGRGLVYALAFWVVYRAMLFVYPPTTSTDNSEKTLRDRYASQLDASDEQSRRAQRMFDESERQQMRMGAVITKQEEQAKRFDAILGRWERQAPPTR